MVVVVCLWVCPAIGWRPVEGVEDGRGRLWHTRGPRGGGGGSGSEIEQTELFV